MGLIMSSFCTKKMGIMRSALGVALVDTDDLTSLRRHKLHALLMRQ